MSEGFKREQDGDVVILTLTKDDEATVDLWAEAMQSVIESASDIDGFRILTDVSAREVGFTGYARQTSKELFNQYKRQNGRLGFLFSSKTAPYYARIFFASFGRLAFDLKFFSERDKALMWLKEGDEL
jgi:hypothetical protein